MVEPGTGGFKLLSLLFVDHQVIISNTEDNLQKAAYKLNQIIGAHGFTISAQKIKLMTLRGREQFTGKIVIDIKIIEQVNSFNSFGNLISYEKEMDIDNKLNNYLKIKDISNNTFRPQKTSKNTTAKP